MNKTTIKPFNVVDNTPLPEIDVDHNLTQGARYGYLSHFVPKG